MSGQTGSEILRAILTSGSPAPTDAGDRVRPDAMDQEEVFPFIVFRRVDVYRDYGLDNTLLATRETFHVECWGKTREESEILEQQVVPLLVAANNPPDDNDPDGIDPDVAVRAAVIVVSIWT